ncbi:MAG TPA: T9SS type A sorting domain-containing protein [Chitinophagaceae bacterium]|nr:T9SS type A sorting domain-containing protein [Chitinophagaceae bacterium]
MKKTILFALLIAGNAAAAQLKIESGAQFVLSGNAQLTLHNTGFVNNGAFGPGTGLVRFTGNTVASISGSNPVQFFELEINKNANTELHSSVMLSRNIQVAQRVLLTSGYLNLNGSNLDLGTFGFLDGEGDTKRVTGGGRVIATANLNAPNGVNPGNLGARITSSQNLGIVTIRRGHQPHAVTPGVTIMKFFDIVPVNNTALNATLRLHYLNSDLYGVDEKSMVFAKSINNGATLTNEGFTSRDTVLNYVEKSGLNSLARFTLAAGNYALPVVISAFNVQCTRQGAVITWKTAQEQNSSHFNIESSVNGLQWIVSGTVQAAGSSPIERTYSFTDPSPAQKNFYRLAQYDKDGSAHYTNVERTACNLPDGFSVRPNPVKDKAFINIVAGNASQALVKVHDSKGALVKLQKESIVQGNNQVTINMTGLASGTYTVTVDWNDGQMKKAARVVKQ